MEELLMGDLSTMAIYGPVPAIAKTTLRALQKKYGEDVFSSHQIANGLPVLTELTGLSKISWNEYIGLRLTEENEEARKYYLNKIRETEGERYTFVLLLALNRWITNKWWYGEVNSYLWDLETCGALVCSWQDLIWFYEESGPEVKEKEGELVRCYLDPSKTWDKYHTSFRFGNNEVSVWNEMSRYYLNDLVFMWGWDKVYAKLTDLYHEFFQEAVRAYGEERKEKGKEAILKIWPVKFVEEDLKWLVRQRPAGTDVSVLGQGFNEQTAEGYLNLWKWRNEDKLREGGMKKEAAFLELKDFDCFPENTQEWAWLTRAHPEVVEEYTDVVNSIALRKKKEEEAKERQPLLDYLRDRTKHMEGEGRIVAILEMATRPLNQEELAFAMEVTTPRISELLVKRLPGIVGDRVHMQIAGGKRYYQLVAKEEKKGKGYKNHVNNKTPFLDS